MTQNPKDIRLQRHCHIRTGLLAIWRVFTYHQTFIRYLRLQGRDVLFVCGSDEHGVAISMKAKKEGISPQEVIDKYDGIIRKSFIDFGISFDNTLELRLRYTMIQLKIFFKKLYWPAIL
jgi:methionyl-tRNA synthetase